MRAALYFAVMFPLGDMFGVGRDRGGHASSPRSRASGFGLERRARSIAFLFLTNLILSPIAELSEILDQTQTAIAGWRKVIAVLDVPVDVVEPTDAGARCRRAARRCGAEGVEFAYREGGRVLHGIDVELPAGANVAVVGETGSGKTTFAKLLCRLADPTGGPVELGGVDLRAVAPERRRRRIRLVPQDGFLFDTTIRENVRLGRDGRDRRRRRARVRRARPRLVARDAARRARHRGRRAGREPVGRRAAARRRWPARQLGEPGLLVLDEATSAVDPETERALSGALLRAGRGPHHDQRGPPALDRRGRRPGAGVRRGAARRAGQPRRAGRARRRVRRRCTRAGSATRQRRA